jgi:uncharacterized membrane protein
MDDEEDYIATARARYRASHAPKMLPEQQRNWDVWCDSRAEQVVERQTDLLIEASAEITEERIATEVATLRGELSSLRSEVEAMRAEIAEMRDDMLMKDITSIAGGRRAAG